MLVSNLIYTVDEELGRANGPASTRANYFIILVKENVVMNHEQAIFFDKFIFKSLLNVLPTKLGITPL